MVFICPIVVVRLYVRYCIQKDLERTVDEIAKLAAETGNDVVIPGIHVKQVHFDFYNGTHGHRSAVFKLERASMGSDLFPTTHIENLSGQKGSLVLSVVAVLKLCSPLTTNSAKTPIAGDKVVKTDCGRSRACMSTPGWK
jgi:hypothetical protein